MKIHYSIIEFEKKNYTNELDMISQLSKSLTSSLRRNKNYLNEFDNLIIYYDRGQSQVTKILCSVFSTVFPDKTIKFKEKVSPENYKLFQAADVVCTFELIARKIEQNKMSNSEKRFFKSNRDFKKNYFRVVKSKKI